MFYLVCITLISAPYQLMNLTLPACALQLHSIWMDCCFWLLLLCQHGTHWCCLIIAKAVIYSHHFSMPNMILQLSLRLTMRVHNIFLNYWIFLKLAVSLLLGTTEKECIDYFSSNPILLCCKYINKGQCNDKELWVHTKLSFSHSPGLKFVF